MNPVVAERPLKDLPGPGDPALGDQRRGDARLGGQAGMHPLHEAGLDQALLGARGAAVGYAHGVEQAGSGPIPSPAGGDGRAEDAEGESVVPALLHLDREIRGGS